MKDTMQIVTDRIIDEMEAGIIPWHRPWCMVDEGAYNRVSKRRYSLLNQMMLKHEGEYATFDQWVRLGGHIRKGEKAETVVFWKWQDEAKEGYDADRNDGKDTGDDNGRNGTVDDRKRKPVLRYYHVFHISQVDGIEPEAGKPVLHDENTPVEKAETLLQGYLSRECIHLEESLSNMACYVPGMDEIRIPRLSQFDSAASYYSTVFHEAVHSTGHSSRLARFGPLNEKYGSEEYSKEELIAEMGSAALLNRLGIGTEKTVRNSAAYIQGWLKVLKNDKRFVVSAASKAEKAARFILTSQEGPVEAAQAG